MEGTIKGVDGETCVERRNGLRLIGKDALWKASARGIESGGAMMLLCIIRLQAKDSFEWQSNSSFQKSNASPS